MRPGQLGCVAGAHKQMRRLDLSHSPQVARCLESDLCTQAVAVKCKWRDKPLRKTVHEGWYQLFDRLKRLLTNPVPPARPLNPAALNVGGYLFVPGAVGGSSAAGIS